MVLNPEADGYPWITEQYSSLADSQRIRNFSIVAHIDHGKSTLADRLLQITGALTQREMRSQFLDQMDIERERGITIKAQSARLNYRAEDGQIYVLNLIDTPGHVDFGYEVSRSLAACEGAVLVVDASQGVEAQTLANVYQALDNNLEILPVLNKIDLPGSDIEKTKREIEDLIGISAENAVCISAKEGKNIAAVLEGVVKNFPPPKGKVSDPLQGLIFDAWFDPYQGVILLCRIVNGQLATGQKILMMHSKKEYEVLKLGVFAPKGVEVKTLEAGEVGFIVAGIKDIRDIKIGDTITLSGKAADKPLPGFKEVKPMVFSGIYPVDSADYPDLKAAMEKLSLNDSSVTFEPESSDALGFGLRCGFLGLLHMEIIQERLEREFGLTLVTTAPTVVYRVRKTSGETLEIHNPSQLPPVQHVEAIAEPIVHVSIHTPEKFLGNLIKLCEDRRGKQTKLFYHSPTHILLEYDLPFNEVVMSFYDRIKSLSKGYASLDYEFSRFEEAPLVKMDLLINGEPVDALSWIVPKEKAYYRGKELVTKMKGFIERQMFEVVLQAAIGSKIISRERIAPLRKNVTAKCYGGDITRKRKLLEKQKEGKKRMKQVGKVDIPQEAFLAALSID
ncbi:MAG: elongation factor 4 [Bdellovibrionaceae bacterium]|nr:translation elongation factor 4 [Bdellovibrionales bacterium]MCB9254661.1 elongation factor 4 [Pseudobdellovibrionaceae bacterium]